jgi:hypothetical protein
MTGWLVKVGLVAVVVTIVVQSVPEIRRYLKIREM